MRCPHTVTPMPSHRPADRRAPTPRPGAPRRPVRRPLRVDAGHRGPGVPRPPRGGERLRRGRTRRTWLRCAQKIFEEIRSRVKETDLSVPVVSGPWWYYSRTVEGRQYPSHVRAPLVDKAVRPDPEADAVPGEQVVLDGNVEAGDSEFFSLGALTVSADHRLVAFAVDTAGDERFDAHGAGRRDRRGPRHLAHRHRLRRASSAATAGSSSTRGSTTPGARTRSGGTASGATRPTTCSSTRRPTSGSGWVCRRAGTSGGCSSGWGRRRPRRSTSSTPTTPRVSGASWPPAGRASSTTSSRPVTGCSSCTTPTPPTPTSPGRRSTRRAHEQWVPWLRSGQGERFVSVDAFDRAAVLSLRTGGLTALRVLPRDATRRVGYGEPWDVPVDQPVHSIGLGDNPEPDQDAIQVVVESWVDPAHGARRRPRDAGTARCSSASRCWAASTSRTTPSGESGPPRQTAPACRCPSSTARASSRTAPTPVSSRHTVPTRSPPTRTSPSRGSACSTAGSSTPWRTCAVAGRWVAGGTTRASCTPSRTRSPTPSPRSTTSSRPVGWHPTASDSRVVLPAGCSSARCSTSPPSGSGWPTPPCPSSTP